MINKRRAIPLIVVIFGVHAGIIQRQPFAVGNILLELLLRAPCVLVIPKTVRAIRRRHNDRKDLILGDLIQRVKTDGFVLFPKGLFLIQI